MSSIYDFEVAKGNGDIQPLADFQGKVLLIVNTASKCGFTPQFEGLQGLYDQYCDQGFEILGFPSDQFMNQEFDDQSDIESFCKLNYGVSFPIYQKIDVKGAQQDPLFEYLTEEKKGFLGGEIKWNFTKFLIDRNGKVVRRYPPQATPAKIEKDLADVL
ncbi:glutathione peroxidase [Alkalibacillus flavidus]|uniref:Glutathione peroxidase n=1 Tax=Alkalibacillus flavidus TaxID=546021 RepID=A0ABV2KQS9_9BACI